MNAPRPNRSPGILAVMFSIILAITANSKPAESWPADEFFSDLEYLVLKINVFGDARADEITKPEILLFSAKSYIEQFASTAGIDLHVAFNRHNARNDPGIILKPIGALQSNFNQLIGNHRTLTVNIAIQLRQLDLENGAPDTAIGSFTIDVRRPFPAKILRLPFHVDAAEYFEPCGSGRSAPSMFATEIYPRIIEGNILSVLLPEISKRILVPISRAPVIEWHEIGAACQIHQINP